MHAVTKVLQWKSKTTSVYLKTSCGSDSQSHNWELSSLFYVIHNLFFLCCPRFWTFKRIRVWPKDILILWNSGVHGSRGNLKTLNFPYIQYVASKSWNSSCISVITFWRWTLGNVCWLSCDLQFLHTACKNDLWLLSSTVYCWKFWLQFDNEKKKKKNHTLKMLLSAATHIIWQSNRALQYCALLDRCL